MADERAPDWRDLTSKYPGKRSAGGAHCSVEPRQLDKANWGLPKHALVAVKHLKKLDRADLYDRLVREAAIAETLSGSGVTARLIDTSGLDYERDPYFVQEWLEGRTLEEALDDPHTVMDQRRKERIVSDLRHALQTVHAAGVIHRDVKPSNIMFRDGGVVLIDFGVAYHHEVDRELSVVNETTGTLGYCCPEALDRGPGQLGEHADAWSWACTAVRVLTGHLPYPDGRLSYRDALARGDAPDLEGVPEKYRPTIAGCLSFNLTARAAAFAGSPLPPPVPIPPPPAHTPVPVPAPVAREPRRRLAVLALPVGAVVLAAALLVSKLGDNDRPSVGAVDTSVVESDTSLPIAASASTTTPVVATAAAAAGDPVAAALAAACKSYRPLADGGRPWIMLAGEKGGIGAAIGTWLATSGCDVDMLHANTGEEMCLLARHLPAGELPDAFCPPEPATPERLQQVSALDVAGCEKTDNGCGTDIERIQRRLSAHDWPLLWLPSSSVFTTRLGISTTSDELQRGVLRALAPSIMTTPLAVGLSKELPQSPSCATPSTIEELVQLLETCTRADGEPLRLGRTDPTKSASGFGLSYLLVEENLANSDLEAFERKVLRYDGSAPELLREGGVDVVVAEEKTFLDCGHADCPSETMQPVYTPSDLTFDVKPLNLYSDNPLVGFEPKDRGDAFATFGQAAKDFFDSDAFAAILEAHDFRPRLGLAANQVGAPPDGASAVDPAGVPADKIRVVIERWRETAKPIHILFALDGSASMDSCGDKKNLAYAQAAIQQAVGKLRDGDELMVAMFASGRDGVLRWNTGQGFLDSLPAVFQANDVAGVQLDGRYEGTPLVAASAAAAAWAEQQPDEVVTTVVVLTDGLNDPNDALDCDGTPMNGRTAPAAAVWDPATVADPQVTVHAIAFGELAGKGSDWLQAMTASYNKGSFALASNGEAEPIVAVIEGLFARF